MPGGYSPTGQSPGARLEKVHWESPGGFSSFINIGISVAHPVKTG
jgi:hypothetical protein